MRNNPSITREFLERSAHAARENAKRAEQHTTALLVCSDQCMSVREMQVYDAAAREARHYSNEAATIEALVASGQY